MKTKRTLPLFLLTASLMNWPHSIMAETAKKPSAKAAAKPMAKPMAKGKTFKSPKGYSITAPANWKIMSDGLMGTDVILIAPAAKQFGANVNVVVKTAPKGGNLKQGMPQIIQGMSRVLNGFKEISRGETKVDGLPGIQFTATHKMGTPARVLKMYQQYVVRNGKVYVFTATALNENYATYDSAFKTVLKSVTWNK